MAKNKEKEEEIEEQIEEQEEETLVEEILSPEEVSVLQTELEDLRQEAGENKDGWMRAQAEFMNYKKRVEREQIRVFENATSRVIKRYLDVIDDLDRALANRPAEGEGADWAEGIELVYRKFLTALEQEGVSVMEAEGQEFNPNLHEAISQEESPDHESGQIIEILQKGYMIGERVLRPALVRVAS